MWPLSSHTESLCLPLLNITSLAESLRPKRRQGDESELCMAKAQAIKVNPSTEGSGMGVALLGLARPLCSTTFAPKEIIFIIMKNNLRSIDTSGGDLCHRFFR